MRWRFPLLALSLLLAVPASPRAELGVGAQAPDFIKNMCDQDGLTGRQFILSRDGAGKVVYLQFNNPTCPKCHFLIRTVQDSVYPLFNDNPGVVFVQVAYAYGGYGVSDVVAMIAATGCTQNVIAEDNGTAYSAYGITGIPYSFVIDKNGLIHYSKGGMDIPASEIAEEISECLGGGPPPTPHPCLELTDNGTIHGPGDRVTLGAEVGGVSRSFDAYAVVRTPDGSYLSMTLSGALVPGVVPLAVNIPSHVPFAAYPLMDMTVPPLTLPGEYGVIVGLADPGTLDAFCRVELTETIR